MTDDPKNSRTVCERAYEGLFSAIVPCRDEREALPIFRAEFMRAMESLGGDFEIIFVDDG